MAAFIAEHNLAIRITEHMPKLFRAMFPDSDIAKEINCSRTKTTNIITNIIGNEEKENVIDLLKKSKFSLIIDESTDVSTTKILVLVTRVFVIGSGIKDLFYDLVELTKADAESVYGAIVSSFHKNEIDYKKNLIGLAADGANVMMGNTQSVATLMKQDVPNLFIMKCLCHSFHLVASYSCQQIPENVENFIRSIHNYFKNSAKRIHQFQEFQVFANAKPHKILYPSQTRWLSLSSVVDRVIEQFEALNLYFTHGAFERETDLKNKCAEISECFKDPFMRLYLYFLQFALPFFVNLNKLMQSEKPQIYRIKPEMKNICKSIMDCYIKTDVLDKYSLQSIEYRNPRNFKDMDSMYFGASVVGYLLKNRNLPQSGIQNFKNNCLRFYMQSLDEIFKRFDFNNEVFDHFECLNPESVIKKTYDSIIPLVIFFPNLVKESAYQTLDSEYRSLRNSDILKEFQKKNVEQFWVEVGGIKRADDTLAYPNLSTLMLNLLSLPHSSACCERIFSVVNLNKTKVRNKLGTDTLMGIMRSKQLLGNHCCFEFDISTSMLKKCK